MYKAMLILLLSLPVLGADSYEKVDGKTLRVIKPVESTVTIKSLKKRKAILLKRQVEMNAIIDAQVSEINAKLTEAAKLGITE